MGLDEFSGGQSVSAHRTWKKSVKIQKEVNGLPDTELALLIYSQVKGKAKSALEILEVDELQSPEGLAMVWSILDRAHERMEHERLDEAYAAWDAARRKHGQSMDEWIVYLRKVKLELETQDTSVVITSKMLASKMLRGAGLIAEKRAQVLFNCGGVYDPDRLETVLRVSFPRVHEQERRAVVPSGRRSSGPPSARSGRTQG